MTRLGRTPCDGLGTPAARYARVVDRAFDDLLAANQQYAARFDMQGFDGIAKAGVAVVTCMDSRLDPLGMLGLRPGDAKILRNPGGRVTDRVLVAVVLGTALLGVDRVVIVQHTRCAVASSSEEQLLRQIGSVTGVDASWLDVDAIEDQPRTLAADVHRVTSHPLVPADVRVGGFLYDVDSGRLHQMA